jgi:hypothetical protein
MTYAMVDTYCASYKRPPRAVTLDIVRWTPSAGQKPG